MASTSHASDFRSSVPLSAAWSYVEGSFSNIVFSQGRNVIDAARAALGLNANGTWDDALQGAMISRASALGASWSGILSALQQDAADRTVRAFSLHTAIYFAYYRASGRRFDAILLFPGTVMPLWDVPAPFSRGPSLVAYDPNTDTDPAILDPAALALAVSRSTTGVRLEPGRAAPVSTTRIVTQESAVPAWVVIGLSLLAVGTIVVLTKGARQERG